MRHKKQIGILLFALTVTLLFAGCEYNEIPSVLFGGKGRVLDPGLTGLGMESVAINVLDDSGNYVSGAYVYIDGSSNTATYGSVYLDLNTGPHQIIVKCSGYEDYGPEYITVKLNDYSSIDITMTSQGSIDPYEPNNSINEYDSPYFSYGYDYTYLFTYYDCTLYAATIHSTSDEDWFDFSIITGGAGGHVQLMLTSVPSGCDYDIELYKDGTKVGGSYNSSNASETYDHYPSGTGMGQYKVRVYSASGSNGSSPYQLYMYHKFY